jgi:hypothetical protein
METSDADTFMALIYLKISQEHLDVFEEHIIVGSKYAIDIFR